MRDLSGAISELISPDRGKVIRNHEPWFVPDPKYTNAPVGRPSPRIPPSATVVTAASCVAALICRNDTCRGERASTPKRTSALTPAAKIIKNHTASAPATIWAPFALIPLALRPAHGKPPIARVSVSPVKLARLATPANPALMVLFWFIFILPVLFLSAIGTVLAFAE